MAAHVPTIFYRHNKLLIDFSSREYTPRPEPISLREISLVEKSLGYRSKQVWRLLVLPRNDGHLIKGGSSILRREK
jgi:hypothetical protein